MFADIVILLVSTKACRNLCFCTCRILYVQNFVWILLSIVCRTESTKWPNLHRICKFDIVLLLNLCIICRIPQFC